MRRARDADLELFSLTDHDTVDGVQEALDAGAALGVRVVPGIEISAVQEAGPDVHVLGYALDHRDPELARALERFRADRERRAERMLERLAAAGWALERGEVDARRAAGRPVGRPHLARAVLAAPANAARLRDEGLDGIGPVIRAYLVPGAPAWLPRLTPTVREAIETLHAAGGVAVWAHPFFDVADPDEVLATLERFRAWGIDGVEAFYPAHDRDQTLLLADAAERSGLLTTGSSDFHGPERPGADRMAAFELHGRTPRLGPIGAV